MPKKLYSIDDTYSTVNDSAITDINSFSLSIKTLKSEIEKSLRQNHTCSKKQLEFLLKRL
ncbi:MAG: hypothetical protein FWF73_02625 [Spirochaetes bacterium]|nr:hypothetical protein [Spirochaetota bacterium]